MQSIRSHSSSAGQERFSEKTRDSVQKKPTHSCGLRRVVFGNSRRKDRIPCCFVHVFSQHSSKEWISGGTVRDTPLLVHSSEHSSHFPTGYYKINFELFI